jgi:hypothetical protein
MLYASGLSLNRIAQLFGVSTVAVLKWIRTLGSTLCPKIEPSGDEQVLVMEVDEFWHFLKKKQKSSGFLRPMIVIKVNPFVKTNFKMVYRETFTFLKTDF